MLENKRVIWPQRTKSIAIYCIIFKLNWRFHMQKGLTDHRPSTLTSWSPFSMTVSQIQGKKQFPQRQSFSTGRCRALLTKGNQPQYNSKKNFKNSYKLTTLHCEAKSIKITSIKAVQKNSRGFTWIVRKLI